MRKLALIILDGWGLGAHTPNNAIHMARTPFFDEIWKHYPHTQLQASGEYVGLPEGQIGGSEVGHLTIGAGRIIYQSLPRINKSLSQHEASHGALHIDTFKNLLELGKRHTVHLIGQISPGGVHSHENHIFRLLEIMEQYSCKSPVIHFISDGRDTPPRSGIKSANLLTAKLRSMKYGTVASLIGRFYAMDRDNNMDRTGKAIAVLTGATQTLPTASQPDALANLITAFEESYARDVTDEFIEPIRIDPHFHGIHPSDILFYWNFRSDRMKQLITELPKHVPVPAEHTFTMTRYDKTYPYPVIFEKETVTDTIGEILSNFHMTQLRATETEKAPHVTYFFNGGIERVFAGERRAVAESHKVKHDQIPHMRAAEIHQNIRTEVLRDKPDFILVNFANPDMVGHTGNFQAVVSGVEKVDHELKQLCAFLTQQGYICLITADHGNADIMYDLETKEPHTAHTLNPVPFVVYDPIDPAHKFLKLDQHPENGLSLIAGTALDLMGVNTKNSHYKSLIKK